MINYKQCDSTAEIQQILDLQQKNLPVALSSAAMQQQGFVTVKHDETLLMAMNESWPHTLAKVGNQVIGYALSMHPKFGKDIPILLPMFEKIESSRQDGSYMVMGQICIAKTYRGKGVFRGLYQAMLDFLEPVFTEIITEVDVKNTRSLNAHLSIGFKEILRYPTQEQVWALLSLKNKTR